MRQWSCLADEEGSTNPMVQYRDMDIVLSLKAGTKLTQYKGIAIYCAKYNVVFGVAEFPAKLARLPRSGRRAVRAVTLGQLEMGQSHNVSGFVHRLGDKTILITRFTYDGMSPDGQFVLTANPLAITDPVLIGDERGNVGPLRKYDGRDVFLNLPEGKTLADFAAFAIYCAKYNLDFGHVFFPTQIRNYPLLSAKVNMLPAKRLGRLTTILHNVSGEVYALDEQTLLLKNFSYDGTSPDGKFVLSKTDKIEEPLEVLTDEWNSKDGILEYFGKDMTLRLNPGTKLSDFKSFSIFCADYKLDFGSVVFGVETSGLAKSKEHTVDAGSMW